MLQAWTARGRSFAWWGRPTSPQARSVRTSRKGDRSRARCRRQSSGTSRPIACTFNKLKAARTTPLQLARLLRGAAVDKKAWDAIVIDVRDKTSVADYFVVCAGETDRQVRAIADGMVEAAQEKLLRPLAVDGHGGAEGSRRGRRRACWRGPGGRGCATYRKRAGDGSKRCPRLIWSGKRRPPGNRHRPDGRCEPVELLHAKTCPTPPCVARCQSRNREP